MNTLEFLTSLRKADINIRVDGEGLRINAPSGVMTETLKTELKHRKDEILSFLKKTNSSVETETGTITPIPRDNNIPLSPSQERLWALAQLLPENPSYNMHIAFNIKGSLQVPALAQSLREIIDRHEILRTTFPMVDGNPIQLISPKVTFTLPQVDLRKFDKTSTVSEVDRLIDVEARTPFDLTRGPLLRASLLEVNSDWHVFLVTMHHIISDGWSFSVFFHELSTFYENAIFDKKTALPKLQIQYGDFSRWHREWLEIGKCRPHIEYWRKELRNDLAPLVLPLDRPRFNMQTKDASVQTRKLPSSIAKELNALSEHHGLSENIVFLTAFIVMLFKYSGQEDIIINSPVNGRERDEVKPLIGFFNNIVPIRIILNNDISISELLEKVRIKTLDALEHQNVPLHVILSESHVGRVPLTRAMFDFKNDVTQSLNLSGTTIEAFDNHNGTTNFELTLTAVQDGENYKCTMEYKTALFDNRTIQGMLAYFETVLEQISQTPAQTVSAIPCTINKQQQDIYRKLNENKHRSRLNQETITSIPNTLPDSPPLTKDQEAPEDLGRQCVSQQPRNPLETRMTRIWEELLETSPIGMHENFFDVGGHSLLAIRLFSKIEKVFGKPLSPSTIVQAPTIEQLTDALAMGRKFDSWASVFPIQSRGSKSPLFFVHGIDGLVLNLADLSQLLGPDQPFYGLQSVGLDSTTKPLERIENMAAHYIEEIESIQPEGPYVLAGGCIGGLIAFEIAQQLHSKAKPIAFLGVMDAWLPHSIPYSGGLNTYTHPKLRALQARFLLYFKALREGGLRNWVSLTLKNVPVVLDMVRLRDVYRGNETEKSRGLVTAANHRALQAYTPKPYPGTMTYFLASGRSRTDMDVPDPRLEWKSFATQGCEMIRIPAPDSGQLFARPYVLELGIRLKEALQHVKEGVT